MGTFLDISNVKIGQIIREEFRLHTTGFKYKQIVYQDLKYLTFSK